MPRSAIFTPCSPPNHALFKDLTGLVFERLTVIKYAGRLGKVNAFECRCVCGITINVKGELLSGGDTRSCGYLLSDKNRARLTIHGHSWSAEWKIFQGMKNRCLNPSVRSFKDYGQRGITICDRWLQGEDGQPGFGLFYADMGPRPSSRHSIERNDNDGPYSPDNCVWATRSQQARNTRTIPVITWAGRTQTAWAWSSETGIPAPQIEKRLGRGWSVERALHQPLRGAKSVAG